MRRVFVRMRLTLVLLGTFFFLRGCFHPRMGFIFAQQEVRCVCFPLRQTVQCVLFAWPLTQLTILTIVLPLLYVLLWGVANFAYRVEWGLISWGLPLCIFLTFSVCSMSRFGGPASYAMVFLHLVKKGTQIFGHDPERDSEQQHQTQQLRQRQAENANVSRTKPRSFNFEDHTQPSPREHSGATASPKTAIKRQSHTSSHSQIAPNVKPSSPASLPPIEGSSAFLSLARSFSTPAPSSHSHTSSLLVSAPTATPPPTPTLAPSEPGPAQPQAGGHTRRDSTIGRMAESLQSIRDSMNLDPSVLSDAVRVRLCVCMCLCVFVPVCLRSC